jgi:hypothetical protein
MDDFNHFHRRAAYNHGASAGAFLARNGHAPAQTEEGGYDNRSQHCPFHGRFSE